MLVLYQFLILFISIYFLFGCVLARYSSVQLKNVVKMTICNLFQRMHLIVKRLIKLIIPDCS